MFCHVAQTPYADSRSLARCPVDHTCRCEYARGTNYIACTPGDQTEGWRLASGIGSQASTVSLPILGPPYHTTMTAAGIARSLRSCLCTSVLLAAGGAEHGGRRARSRCAGAFGWPGSACRCRTYACPIRRCAPSPPGRGPGARRSRLRYSTARLAGSRFLRRTRGRSASPARPSRASTGMEARGR